MKIMNWLTRSWVLALALLAGCSSEPAYQHATLDGGFYQLPLDAALAKAKAENKVVMVDFYTETCHWCKVLDEKTWKDGKVQDWLKENTVAIKLDAEKDIQSSKKYYVRSYPEMVFLKPDGSVVGRISGFRPPEEFLKEAAERLTGKPTT